MFQQPPWQGPGTGSLNQYTLEILVMLGVAFLLGYLFWYFWNKQNYTRQITHLKDQVSNLKAHLTGLKTDLEECKNNRLRLKSTNADLERRYIVLRREKEALEKKLENEIMASGTSSTATIDYDKAFNTHDLQVVEGIGPKIESLLKSSGIGTWRILADSPIKKLKDILHEAGPHFRIHNPETWPKQAELADQKDWNELTEYQKFLGGGKTTSSKIGGHAAKIEKLALRKLNIPVYKTNDLKIVEGIGPKTDKLLRANGITTWKELANTSPEELQQILEKGGAKFQLLNPSTWPKQAELANKNDWKALKEYQDYLIGGKDPAQSTVSKP